MEHFFRIAILAIVLSFVCKSAKAQVSEADSIGLVKLYVDMNGSTWTNDTNWLKKPVRQWFGVKVREGRVVEINLENNHLDGVIPHELGNLAKLYYLNLDYNNIVGDIPISILMTVDEIEINNVTGFYPENTRIRYISYH